MDAFVIAFGVILLAELGDKSQLLTLAFASRYPAWLVLLGVSLAALVMLGLSVLLGSAFAMALPSAAIQLAAGITFLAFAAWSLRPDRDDHHTRAPGVRGLGRVAMTVAVAFLIAEFGDKTMLATLTIAATQEPLGTWLGASAGMVSANLAAIAIGSIAGARLPERPIRLAAAAAFAAFGVLLIAQAAGLI